MTKGSPAGLCCVAVTPCVYRKLTFFQRSSEWQRRWKQSA